MTSPLPTHPGEHPRGRIDLAGEPSDYDQLMHNIADRRFVLIGEASHGTHEFYRERAVITRRLIKEKGFTAVAVEADWPDAYRVNRYVRGQSKDTSASASLGDFRRFPAWMWRNTDVVDFVSWLRGHNEAQPTGADKVGFYGLDLYSLRASMDAVVDYLDSVDPAAADAARQRYACFDTVQGEGQRYGHAVNVNIAAPCEDEVINELMDLRTRQAAILSQDGWLAKDEFFFAEQNARLVMNAERYYRQMYRGSASSWNLRDGHMVDTLNALARHLDQRGNPSKIVVWAHNSHVGDARFTQMSRHGEINVGQLVRQSAPLETFIVGFTTDHGYVTAASEWGGPAERKRVRSALPNSYEHTFHGYPSEAFMLLLDKDAGHRIPENLIERAIGVIYRPQTERESHWFHADLAHQFDAVIHIDQTSALVPLERTTMWDMGEPPETYPTGL